MLCLYYIYIYIGGGIKSSTCNHAGGRFNKATWDLKSSGEDFVTLSYVCPEMPFPGTVTVELTYTVASSEDEGVSLRMSYSATTTKTTPNNSSQSSEIASASPWQVQWQQASMKVYHNVNRGVYELMAENVADQTRLAQNQSEKRVIKFDLDHHLSLTATSCEAVFLQETTDLKDYVQSVVSGCFMWDEKLANTVQNRYLFVLHDLPSHTPHTADFLRPLDIAYIARLCIYENRTRAVKLTQQRDKKSETPAHTFARDEELWTILATAATPELDLLNTNKSSNPFSSNKVTVNNSGSGSTAVEPLEKKSNKKKKSRS